ncbi:MAG: hypothetical protein AVDCRST_MAG88-2637 [uncultured Thermomicrobiales bacterium]|uniref:Uncharacterized protein n=1 Tax=uncultured Thermomicrobiales bacterium TaxID=1645740 RepID=A0A6J4VF91_9BACT|nr:MAG: hypothetical protein AVDCRST_MAG88-2637 [uncultured Thermomicrobiales bacterium]
METMLEGPALAPTAVGDRAGATRRWPAWRSWRYADDGGRDLRFDLLRGFAVFAMVADHVAGPSWLYALTGGNRFFVSAAEGFVFLSGIVVGIVYGGIARSHGLGAATAKLVQRAWTLYALAVWLAIGTAVLAAILDSPAAAPFAVAPARFIVEVVTLRRTFYLVDVLLLYLFALLVTPLALVALRRGWWWAVAGASWALWGAYQVDPHGWRLPWPIADNPVFGFAPWQVLFFTGLLLGYYRRWLGAAVAPRLRRLPLARWYPLPLLAGCGALVWLHATDAAAFNTLAPNGDAAAILDSWFDKSALPLPRLLASFLVFGAAWALVTHLWEPLRRLCGPFLLTLGQGALYAYAAHLVLAALVDFGAAQYWGRGAHGGFPDLAPGVNMVLQSGALGVLWVLTRHRFLQEVAKPLGRPPFVPVHRQFAGRPLWRPSDALLAVALVGMVAGSAALSQGRAGAAPAVVTITATQAPPDRAGTGDRAHAGAAPAVSTVTAPRRIAGTVTPQAPTVDQVPTAAAHRSGVGTSATAVQEVATAVAVAAGETATGRARGYLQDAQFFSPTLGRAMPYGIYLPPGYDAGTARYPVLYMLHGIGGHYSEWVAYGLPETAERLLAGGRIQPLIIVFAQGDESYFANHAGGAGERWGDYLAFDLVGHIDATYRTIPQRAARAVGGLSMGGFGALHLAFTHPGVFGAAGAHSPALRTYEEAPAFLGDRATYAAVDPLALARGLDPAGAPKVWIDVGVEDDWAARTTTLKDELRARGIRPEYRETAGGHDPDYWKKNAGIYLRYYAAALTPEPAP